MKNTFPADVSVNGDIIISSLSFRLRANEIRSGTRKRVFATQPAIPVNRFSFFFIFNLYIFLRQNGNVLREPPTKTCKCFLIELLF